MAKADTLVKNSLIITPRGSYTGHIYIREGRIAAISKEALGEASRTIDAGGKPVIPGVVDEHVHMMDPGHTEREDFTTGTRAAARGGTTTVIEHHRTEPQVLNAHIVKEKGGYLKEKAVVDFGLLGGLTPGGAGDLLPMWEAGALGFKGFLVELHGALPLSQGDLLEGFKELARFDGIALLHCESDSLIKRGKERLKERDYLMVSRWRSKEAELLAARDVVQVAELTGARAMLAHTSQPAILREVAQARLRGARVLSESCPQYFHLTTENLAKMGPFCKFTPPPREPEIVEGMWECLRGGLVETIGSDHCPYPRAEKEAGLKDIDEAPFGIPGVETSLRLMLKGVAEGKLTLEKLVQVMCEAPARHWGLYPRKGAIEVGSDADLVILDLERKERLSNAAIVSKCGWTPYDGWDLRGAPVLTMVRGKIVMEDGEVMGEAGWGEWVKRHN